MKILFKVQGERRFFRVIMKWLVSYDLDAARRNLEYVAEFGRWDDLYCFTDTVLAPHVFEIIKKQLALDATCETPSLLAKWLKSENASSKESMRLGNITRIYLKMSHRQYRKMLAHLRAKINIVERLMSENRWDEIQFDKIPSKAGLIYKNAFARRDIIREKYERFAKDADTKVNAGVLYPYEVVEKAIKLMGSDVSYYWHDSPSISMDNVDRLMINKYWENMTDYFAGSTLNALCMIDTSGSMHGTPINVAVALGLYCAERAGGPFANHYISFSSRPQLIECEGVDFCDKVNRIVRTNLCENTNIRAAFDMLLNTAKRRHLTNKDMPENIIIISDMEFDQASYCANTKQISTVMENIANKWKDEGYECPNLVFWNVDARSNNIPMLGTRVSFVSGFSPSIFQTIASGKTGMELMMEKLNSPRYACIH